MVSGAFRFSKFSQHEATIAQIVLILERPKEVYGVSIPELKE